jgi:hypothetical protein
MWLFRDKTFSSSDIPEGAVGFVYTITNNDNGLKYVGQKRFYRPVTKAPLKGQTKKRKSIIESDWKTYVGSSLEVKKQVKELGLQAFTREIHAICYTKGMLSYTESKMQFDLGVLFDDNYLNGIINCRINKSHVINAKANYC